MRRHRAFTLIELLVVISIIALLISILLPALKKARFQGEVVNCLARIKQMNLAHQNYTIDHDGYFSGNKDLPGPGGVFYDYDGWIPDLLPYVGSRYTTTSTDYYNRALFPEIQCPGDASGIQVGGYTNRGFVYAILTDLRWQYDRRLDPVEPYGLRGQSINFVRDPSNKGLVVDNGRYASASTHIDMEQYGLAGHPAGFNIATPNHQGRGLSVSYMDGHAQFVASLRQAPEFTNVASFPDTSSAAPDSPWRYKKFWINPGFGYIKAPLLD